MNGLKLMDADRVEVISLVDNYTDVLMESTDVARRAPIMPPKAPLAEHGLSCLIKVFAGGEEHHVLLDTGQGPICITHNMEFLGLDARTIEAVVISHGHVDHVLGLAAILERAKPGVPVIAHPDVFVERRHRTPEGRAFKIPGIEKEGLRSRNVNLVILERPTLIASGLVLVSNKVERVTSYEKGVPFLEANVGGEWVVDPFNDDQAVAVNVKGKGLVVIVGCSHAGIINTVRYCRKLSGTEKVHAVLGGFHLDDKIFQPIIGPTVEAMKAMKPDYVVPMHCTGFNAMFEFARQMPGRFIPNCTCTTYRF